MRKSYKHYISSLTQRLNENPPVKGYEISDKEVEVVLNYFVKNFIQIIKKYDSEIIITRKMMFFPVKNHVVKHKARVKKKMKPIYKRLKHILAYHQKNSSSQ